jgi:hypothetical protein
MTEHFVQVRHPAECSNPPASCCEGQSREGQVHSCAFCICKDTGCLERRGCPHAVRQDPRRSHPAAPLPGLCRTQNTALAASLYHQDPGARPPPGAAEGGGGTKPYSSRSKFAVHAIGCISVKVLGPVWRKEKAVSTHNDLPNRLRASPPPPPLPQSEVYFPPV